MPQAEPPSRSTRFDPLRLLSEIQADQPSPRAHDTATGTNEDEDDDFMSDKFLAIAETKQPLTYTDKRRKLEAHRSPSKAARKSVREQEEEARREGLDRDLLAEAEIVAGGGVLPPEGKGGVRRWDLMEEGVAKGKEEDGRAKAMRMMLAMGYRRGEALGRRMRGSAEDQEQEVEEEDDNEEDAAGAPPTSPPDDTDTPSLDTDEEQELHQQRQASQAREEDEYLAGGASLAPLAPHLNPTPISTNQTEPLRPDQRWLGLHRRAGIGMIPKTSPDVAHAIRAKAAANSQQAVAQQSEDFRTRIARSHVQRHTAALLHRARKTLEHLDTSALSIAYSPLWLNSELYHKLAGDTPSGTESVDEQMTKDSALKLAVELLQLAFSSEDEEQRMEAQAFVELDAEAQLELLLERLRGVHQYCLFCGCQYQDADELARLCPGTAEDDHD